MSSIKSTKTPQRAGRLMARTLSLCRDPSPGMRKKKITYPKEYANKKVQESDGNFFESFTALAWKQENRRRRAASEDDAEAKKPPPSEGKLGPRHNRQQLAHSEFERLYLEVLYTIKHKIGATRSTHLPYIQDLYLYAREAFGVSPEDHAMFLAKASEEKPPILILDVTVVEARDLEAKDADGFSDPYCMLGILPGNRALQDRVHERVRGESYSSDEEGRGRGGPLKKFSQSFKKKKEKTARDLVPAKYIKVTSVKNNSLNPSWEEKFRFDLDDIKNDSLHLDIWDHDDEFSVVDAAKQLNQVQGFKGLGRYFKQIAQSARTNRKGNVDDFLGAININLDDIPSHGLDEWFDLECRSNRSNVEGQCHLRLSLATREDRGHSEEDIWNEIKEQVDLICVFIEYELGKFKGEDYQWTGELSQAATAILHQHAIQGDITDVQQSMCRFSAYSEKHQEHPFDWSLILRLLEDLDEKWEPASLSRDEEDFLSESITKFINYCLGLLATQREVYPPANKAATVRLQFVLRCLVKIHEMPVFKKCCPFAKDLHVAIVSTLKKSNTDWYERQHHTTRPRGNKEEDTLCSMIELTNLLNTDLQKALQYYAPLYKKIVDVDYFSVVYRQIEKLLYKAATQTLKDELGDDLNRELESISFSMPDADKHGDNDHVTPQMMGTTLFELYLALNEFCTFREHVPPEDRCSLIITQYYDWYKVPVQRWLTMSKFKVTRRVKKAVDLDQVGGVEGHVKQSTSAVDVACCFGQVIEFWKSINWPDHGGALYFILKITEDLCQAAMYYADLIHEKLKSAGYYDEIGQFDVTEQLCMTINDIEQVRRSLKPIPEAMRYTEVLKAVERDQGELAAKQGHQKLHGIMKTADDVMVTKIKTVVDRVADKMRPDIKKFVFHLCWAPEKATASDAISELMNYLDSNLLTLNTNLLRANFDRILDSIWIEVLEEIQEVLSKEEVKAKWFFDRLCESLVIMVDFFHANEKGLTLEVIHNPLYKSVHQQLILNKSNTHELVDIFYKEMILEQDKCEATQFGTLRVRVYYNTDAEILSVEVLSGRNIIPLDPNGLSDPFVMIELCPNHTFPKQTVQQTQIIKNSLNPIFDASFEFCVSRTQCRQPGSCIMFTVMDHDFMLANDFAGECFLSLNNIPGISGEEISGFSALTPLSLHLTQPKKIHGGTRAEAVLDALRIRDTDKVAQEFVKKRKQKQAQAME